MSAPSGPIQQLLPGFLSLLNLKNKGLLPDVLQGFVQPTIDLEGYLLRGSLEAFAGTATPGVSPGSFFPSTGLTVVPNNEIWYFENFSVATRGIAAADTLGLTPAYRANVGAGTNNFFVGPQVARTGLNSRLVAVSGDFWVPAGGEMGAFIEGTSVGAIVLDFTGRYSRFRV